METSRQPDCGQTQKWLGLRFLIPSLILATMLTDVALRFVPPDRIYFHAWEAATLFPTAEGSFTPNFRYENNRAFGDLANLGNLPRFRRYHTEIFTTDEFGFRNPPSRRTDEMPAAILIGDSFAVGASNSDEDTLSAQLTSRLSTGRVYNGGNARPKWTITKDLIERLHMRGGLVIWEVSEREQLPESAGEETHCDSRVAPMTAPPISKGHSILQRLNGLTDWLVTYSPLKILFSSAYRKIENGFLLPNPSGNLVLVSQLRNGDDMLFLKSEVDNFYQPKYDSPNYLFEISALLHCSGNELLVVLVPDKYGVYYPLLRDKQQSPPEGESHLNRLEQDLQRLGVPVLNLMAPLRLQAAEGLQKREYNYRLDDTHWNRAGIQTAATEILRTWNNRAGSISDTSIRRDFRLSVKQYF